MPPNPVAVWARKPRRSSSRPPAVESRKGFVIDSPSWFFFALFARNFVLRDKNKLIGIEQGQPQRRQTMIPHQPPPRGRFCRIRQSSEGQPKRQPHLIARPFTRLALQPEREQLGLSRHEVAVEQVERLQRRRRARPLGTD